MIAATRIPESRIAALMRKTGMARLQAYYVLTERDRAARRAHRKPRP